MKTPIYLDNQATTPVDPKVLETMLPYFKEHFGNPASKSHSFGWRAEEAVDKARGQVAQLIGAEDPEEIIFTSGATESNNLALQGIAQMYRGRGNHIITTAIEHHSVHDTCQALEHQGFSVTYLPVDQEGLISIKALKEAITDKSILISVIFANNEIGVVQPMAEIGKIAREKNIFFHSDIVQAAGKVPVDVNAIHCDLASLTAHKMYGPKGAGALYVRRKNPRVRLAPLLFGGGHERGLRPGTVNVAGAVGLGRAAEISARVLEDESKRLLKLREKLTQGIIEQLDQVRVNGSASRRIPGNMNLSFAYAEGGALLKELADDIAISSGSACTSGASAPSYVLKALGVKEALQHTSIRFGIGRFNSEEEIAYVVKRVVEVVTRLRKQSPLCET